MANKHQFFFYLWSVFFIFALKINGLSGRRWKIVRWKTNKFLHQNWKYANFRFCGAIIILFLLQKSTKNYYFESNGYFGTTNLLHFGWLFIVYIYRCDGPFWFDRLLSDKLFAIFCCCHLFFISSLWLRSVPVGIFHYLYENRCNSVDVRVNLTYVMFASAGSHLCQW